MTVEQLLDRLRQGVDEQTWTSYAQHLREQGAHVADAAADARGFSTVEVTFGRHDAWYVARDVAGQWFLVSPAPRSSRTAPSPRRAGSAPPP